MFQVNPLLGRGVTRKIKPYFLRKIKEKKIKRRLLQFLFGALRVTTNTMYMYHHDSILKNHLLGCCRVYIQLKSDSFTNFGNAEIVSEYCKRKTLQKRMILSCLANKKCFYII